MTKAEIIELIEEEVDEISFSNYSQSAECILNTKEKINIKIAKFNI